MAKVTEQDAVSWDSADISEERVEKLKQLFPDAFTEGKVDFEKLRQALGDLVDDRPERYSFTWAGKRNAIRLLQIPSRATLVPAPKESVNFDTTQNLFIEGDNLEVLKLLYKSYAGRVKMIYIDPPYNIGNEFVYPDNYTDPLDTYLELTNQTDGDGNFLTSNPETSGRYHSRWLSMMYPRLFVARQLLQDDGVIFVSINDQELDNLRLLMNEIYGEENWIGTIAWKGATDNNPTQIAVEHEYILCYGKQKNTVAPVWKNQSHDAKKMMLDEYKQIKKNADHINKIQQEFRHFVRANQESLVPLTHYTRIDEHGPYTGSRKVHNPKPGGYEYDVYHPITNKVCVAPANGYRYPTETMDKLLEEDRIIFGKDDTQIIQIKEYLEDYEGKLSSVITLDSRTGANELEALFSKRKLFPNPKPALLLREIFDFCVENDDLILDFFAGSCSSAQAIFEMNLRDNGHRQMIMIQLPEPTPEDSPARNAGYATIADIGKERIRRVINKMNEDREGELELNDRKQPEDLGFKVFKLAESHYRQWSGVEEKDPEKYAKTMELFADPLLPGWKPLNIIYEVALKEGYSLTSTVEELKEVTGNTIYRVTDPDKDQSFLICLDNELKIKTVKAIKLDTDAVFVCRDSALTDELAANVALQCHLKTI